MLLQLGATCSLQLHEGVTHLVSGGPTTDKARLALKKGIPVVLADWLQASGKALALGLSLHFGFRLLTVLRAAAAAGVAIMYINRTENLMAALWLGLAILAGAAISFVKTLLCCLL